MANDNPLFNLTSFLFGNVDDNGQLIDDILDDDCKKHLNSLGKLGLQPLLTEIIGEDAIKSENIETTNDSFNDFGLDVKSPSAIDYSDENEIASDPLVSDSNEEKSPNDFSSEVDGSMPPPSTTVSGSKSSSASDEMESRKRKLETPLAAMLPAKYANVDVTEFFPDFRFGKVLRFSRVFGPGKPGLLPKIWRPLKKRRNRTKADEQAAEESDRKVGWSFNYATPPTSPTRIMSDDEEKLLQPIKNRDDDKEKENIETIDMGPRTADWRFGPAQLWYDMLNVPDTGDGFDYGFKQNEPVKIETEAYQKSDVPDESFLMVAQITWEDDIIWDDSDETRQRVMQNLNCKTNAAGWLPSSSNRTAQTFPQPGKGMISSLGNSVRLNTGQMNSASKVNAKNLSSSKQTLDDNTDDTWYSIFPVENEELVYGTWEDEIIWDPEAVNQIPKPKILTLDPNDENIILGIPDDVDPQKQRADNTAPVKVKIPHPHVKKSKLLLGKAGVINVLEEDTPPPPAKSPDHDPFNVSNDSYYLPRSSEKLLKLKAVGGNLIQHSTPVVELQAPFVQTQMGPNRLRNFHRPPLKRYSHGALARPVLHPVSPLTKYIKKKAKLREQERVASGGGDVFFMRTPEDLTGRDGELILVEFCEEHPPLINQVGMCSKIKNYYKRKASKDEGPTNFRYGEVAYAHSSPFLGVLPPGKSIQVVENNMYRAPIYEHKIPETDFLVLRTRHQYFIREIDALFTVGQLGPLYEVPGPNSKRANNFVRDFLQVFIYRLFWKSKDTPKRIRMDDIKKAFPSHSESSIRKRLKQCADFKRTGIDSNWWVIKPDFRLPPEEEIRAMVSPEQCCAYFSMIAAEQRLKDAGYGEKFLFTPEDDDEDLQLKMDDEIKVAPWNTTRAYIQAMKGKCLLQLTGPADPTGCGEGFSYVRMPNKPMTKHSKEDQESQPKRVVTGTDADLRRLNLKDAKALLRKFGVPEEEIKKLSRWEVIDVVRTLSTEKAKAGEEGMTKFSRGNRFSIAEHQERYKEECQRIFDLQNRVLSSCEVLSTDEGESSDEEDGSDIEEMGKNIEHMLANKKTSLQLSLEREEQERQELRKMMYANDDKKPKDKKKEEEDFMNNFANNQSGRVLKIYRTFRDPEGREYTRMEVVRKQAVIDAYVKIRKTKDEGFIKQFASVDDAQKEEMKREKRRIQEQLRRIKRNQEKERTGNFRPQSGLHTMKQMNDSKHNMHDDVAASAVPVQRRRPVKIKPDLKVKCGACGATGHMRTNRACPQYQSNDPSPSVNVAMTQEQENEFSKQLNEEVEDLINVDGTKVKISSKLIKHAEDMKRRTLLLKVPRDALSRKRKSINEPHCDYLKKHQKPVNRRRTDPLVVLSTILEAILKEMRTLPSAQEFLFPVNAKKVPDYYNIVTRPMDLQTIRDNIRQKRYQTRKEFLDDVNQIYENSALYNGAGSKLTENAKELLEVCCQRLRTNEDKLMKLEKVINPLLDDDDQVALSFMLANILEKLEKMSQSLPFMKPVNKRVVRDYYDVVKYPMDLETISNNIKAHKYHSRNEFLADIELILKNCIVYNGRDSSYSERAEELLKTAQSMLAEFDEHLTTLEHKIKLVQERAKVRSLSSSWYGGDDDHTQESMGSSPLYSKSQHDYDISDMDMDSKDFIKTESQQLLADDLHCSSEDDADDDDMMEEVKGEFDDPSAIDYNQTQVAAAEAMMQLGNFAYLTSGSDAMAVDGYGSVLPRNRAMESKNFDDDFLLCREDAQGKRDYQELTAGVPEDSNSVQADLEISDSDDESKSRVRNIEVPEQVVNSNTGDGDDEDYDDLWF